MRLQQEPRESARGPVVSDIQVSDLHGPSKMLAEANISPNPSNGGDSVGRDMVMEKINFIT